MTIRRVFDRMAAAAARLRLSWPGKARRPHSPPRSRALGAWLDQTPRIRPAIVPLSPPRVCAGRIAVAERVRRFYEQADEPMQAYLWAQGWPSGLEQAF